MTAIALQHREEIIEQMAQGAMLDEVAGKLGIAAPNISVHLSKDPEYIQARQTGAQLRLERAYKRVDEIAGLGIDEEAGKIVGISSELHNLARVRDSTLKAAQWFAEREFPERWGQKPTNITINNNVLAISDSLVGTASDLLGKLRVSNQPELSTVQHEQIAQEIGK